MEYEIEEVRALDGKQLVLLSDRERTIYDYFVAQGRKYGISIDVVSNADKFELMVAKSKEQADQILRNADSKLFVTIEQSRNEAKSIYYGARVKSNSYMRVEISAGFPSFDKANTRRISTKQAGFHVTQCFEASTIDEAKAIANQRFNADEIE